MTYISFEDRIKLLSDDELMQLTIDTLLNELLGISFNAFRKEELFNECNSRKSGMYENAFRIAFERSNQDLPVYSDTDTYIDTIDESIMNHIHNLVSSIKSDLLNPVPNSTVEIIAENFSMLNDDKVMLFMAEGDSMINAGIYQGDILWVNKKQQPKSGDIIIAEVEGKQFVKRIITNQGLIILRSENKKYFDIQINDELNFKVIGVVIMKLKSLNQ